MSQAILSTIGALAGDALRVLLDAAVKSSALFVAAIIVALMLRRSSAARRHVVWSMAVAGALAMPLLSRLVPSVAVPLPIDPIEISGPIESTTQPRVAAEPNPMLLAVGPGTMTDAGERADPHGERVSVEQLHRALGIGERERVAATEPRTQWLEDQTRAIVIRQRAMETRIDRLEELLREGAPGPGVGTVEPPDRERDLILRPTPRAPC